MLLNLLSLSRTFATATKKKNYHHLKLRAHRVKEKIRSLRELPSHPSSLPTVSLVGLPNVGKSTLYNRLTRQDQRRRGARAIVASTPQTTRDFRESIACIGDMHFSLVDTGGLETGSKQQRHGHHHHDKQRNNSKHGKFGSHAGLEEPMLNLTSSVIRRSDVVFLMLDGKNGISVLDDHFARWLRKLATDLSENGYRKGVIYPVINKVEGLSEDAPEFQTLLADAYRLGFGEPIFISAEQGYGFADLFQAISNTMEDKDDNASQVHVENNAETERDKNKTVLEVEDILQLAIVGRPNVGKSTLLNQLVGEERVLTGPTPGLTRDPVRIEMRLKNAVKNKPQLLRIVDTAGIRRPGKRDSSTTIESEAVAESMHALQYSQVVAVMIDASEPPTRMDMALVGRVLDEGRALVVVANKTDTINCDGKIFDTMTAYLNHTASSSSARTKSSSKLSNVKNGLNPSDELGKAVLEHLSFSIPQIKDVPVVAMSAMNGDGVDALLPAVMEAYNRWDQRITTGTLNQWIAAVQRHTPPPRGATIKFGSQVSNRPPKFLFFSNGTQQVPEHYIRFLSKSLREEFNMGGVPIRVKVVPKDKRASTRKQKK
jgi:GTP-binding protein